MAHTAELRALSNSSSSSYLGDSHAREGLDLLVVVETLLLEGSSNLSSKFGCRAELDLSADGAGVFLSNKVADNSGSVLADNIDAKGLDADREDGADLVNSVFDLLLSGVVSELALKLGHDPFANSTLDAIGCLGGRNSGSGCCSSGSTSAELDLSAELVGWLLVDKGRDDSGSVLVNESNTCGLEADRDNLAHVSESRFYFADGSVGAKSGLKFRDYPFAESALKAIGLGGSDGDLLLDRGSGGFDHCALAESESSANGGWGSVVEDQLDDQGSVLCDDGVAFILESTGNIAADFVEEGYDLSIGSIVRKLVFNQGDDVFASNAFEVVGGSWGSSDCDNSRGVAQMSSGASLGRGVVVHEVVNEHGEVKSHHEGAFRGKRARNHCADLVQNSLYFSLRAGAIEVAICVLDNVLAESAFEVVASDFRCLNSGGNESVAELEFAT